MKHRTRPALVALAIAGALAAGGLQAETGTVLKATELRSEPLGSAQVLAKLAAKDSVDITERKGAWAGVKTTAGQDGWVRILNLRTGSGEAAASGSGATALASAFATGSSGTSVSTGVKGLSAESLRSASPDFAQVQALDGYAANDGDARQFAGQVPLAAKQVKYLPEPKSGRRNK